MSVFPICNVATTPTTTSWSPSLDEGGKRMTALWHVRIRFVRLSALNAFTKAFPVHTDQGRAAKWGFSSSTASGPPSPLGKANVAVAYGFAP